MLINDGSYLELVNDIKKQIAETQRNAIFAVNKEVISLYWNIGKLINNKSVWGNKFVENLERDIKLEFPNATGYSLRNLKYMMKFAKEYDEQFVHQLGAQIPWRHHTELMDKIKDMKERVWYMEQVIENGWSRSMLLQNIEWETYKRQVQAIKTTNFKKQLPSPQSELVEQTIKDPYIFEIISLKAPKNEREVESALVQNIARLLMELGSGFAFLGNQYHIVVENIDYYIDMLFYNVKLKCYVVVELKTVEFAPEFAGKLNFYISAIDSMLKSKTDNSTIGILLCKGKKGLTTEYSLRDIAKPIGVSSYKLVEKLPKELENILPSAEDIKTRIKID